MRRIRRDARRKVLLERPLPDGWEEYIERNVTLYHYLPEELKSQLHGLIQVFLAEKRFEGCGGLELTDEIKVTIAAQGCMLLLNRKTKFFPKLTTILVYPHAYVAKKISSNGFLEVEGHSVRLGESWQNGPVVLAWDSVTGGALNITDGQNVVLHEFAHRLDQEDGSADGAPILESRSCYGAWASVLSQEYETLQKKTKKGRRSVINKYGASHPAEFFAVITEAFFEKPRQMLRKHPDLYNELKEYYKVNPLEWKKDSARM